MGRNLVIGLLVLLAVGCGDFSPSMPPSPTPGVTAPLVAPDSLDFGALDYTMSGCFSSAWRGDDGASLSGVDVNFRITVENLADEPAERIWLVVRQSEDLGDRPRLLMTAWTGVPSFANERLVAMKAPPLRPGRTTMVWTVLFASRSDPHFEVVATAISPGEVFSGDAPMDDVVYSSGELWTRNSVCSPDERDHG